MSTFIKKFGKGKSLTYTSHLSLCCSPSPSVDLQHGESIKVCTFVFVCVWAHLRQHGVLPPPGHADGEQVIDRGGILQTGLASLGLVRETTDHRFAAGLDRERGWVKRRRRRMQGGKGGRLRKEKRVADCMTRVLCVCVCSSPWTLWWAAATLPLPPRPEDRSNCQDTGNRK